MKQPQQEQQEEKTVTTQDIRDYIASTNGDFNLDSITRDLNIEKSYRNSLRAIISRLSRDGLCKAIGNKDGWYRRVDTTLKPVIFWESSVNEGKMPIGFPVGRLDSTKFDFYDKGVEVFRGDIILGAGVTNTGKSALCANICADNCDAYKIRYLNSQYDKFRFWDRMKQIDWVEIFKVPEPKNSDDCKFELIPMASDFEDAIDGSADITIIDWILMPEEPWKIAALVRKIKTKMKESGIAIVMLQQDPYKTYPAGGIQALQEVNLAVKIEFERLTITKCKSNGDLDNKLMYGFQLKDKGTKFYNIREIVKCSKCHGNCKIQGYKCDKCKGTGYLDKEEDLHDVI